ncbi:MAG TPA: porphobilinogen synthase [Candidatus Nitrosopolaris sp.]|nr:porphobilinogen synthase [Candidatus Nitrosopolaris sp.]
MQKCERNKADLAGLLHSVGLNKKQLVCPLFVKTHAKEECKIDSLPGVSVVPIEETTAQTLELINLGISSIIIFGVPVERDAVGSNASDQNGTVQKTVRKLKMEFGNALNIITDVCLCHYNLSGHCGLLTCQNDFVDNDGTVQALCNIAVSHAQAGADMVSPSSMMDGQVSSIRTSLDKHGYDKIKILAVSAKHFSSLYSPFRSLAFSEQIRDYKSLDKSSYQLPFSNRRESVREIENDIREGADMVIIKPSILYLDVISLIKEKLRFPIAAQNVSGEYAMIKSAAANNWINEEEWKVTSICAMKRAGADSIISYFCKDIATILDCW